MGVPMYGDGVKWLSYASQSLAGSVAIHSRVDVSVFDMVSQAWQMGSAKEVAVDGSEGDRSLHSTETPKR